MYWLFEPVMLAFEAHQVIALRMAKLAFGGPAAMVEAERMVSEKFDASAKAARVMSLAMMTCTPDGGAAEIVRMLRRSVSANKRRLCA